jgi:hypothetical protein
MEYLGKIMIPESSKTHSVNVSSPLSGDGTSAHPLAAPTAYIDTEPTYTLLWSASSAFRNQYSIVLNDSIDNYDEVIYYGSANRDTNTVKVATEYPVYPGAINLGGPAFCGNWQTSNTYELWNGTQVWLSGTSGYVNNSYYWGMQNGGTGYESNNYSTPRNADVHPYKIVGVKY